MQVPERLADLVRDGRGLFLSEKRSAVGVVLDLMEQLATLQVLCYQKETLFILESFVELEKVWVVQGLKQESFCLEVVECLCVERRLLHDSYCSLLLRNFVKAQPDLAVRSFADAWAHLVAFRKVAIVVLD